MKLILVIPSYFVFILFLFSCHSIKIFKLDNPGTTIYYTKEKTKYEEFSFNGKDTFSLNYQENKLQGIENTIPNPRKVWIRKEKTFICYKYDNNETDTFYLCKDKFFLTNSINPFCITLPTTICNNVHVSNVHGNKYLLRYLSDSIHFYNNQPPVNSYIFEYIGLKNGKLADTLGYIDPILVEISSLDGVILGSRSTFLVPFEFESKSSSSHSIIDYRQVFTTRQRLKKFLM